MPDTRLRAWEGGLKGRLVRVARAARKRAVEATSSAIFLTPPRTFERAEILRKCVLGRDRFLEGDKDER